MTTQFLIFDRIPTRRKFDGALSPNDRLTAMEKLNLNQFRGPESLAFYKGTCIPHDILDHSNEIILLHQISKADRPHPRNYPTDYRHTDKYLRLVMPLITLYCTRQSRAPNNDRSRRAKKLTWPLTLTQDLWSWPRPLTLTLKQGNSDVKTQFLAFDLDLWPTTLTYSPNLAKVKVDPHAKKSRL